MDGWMDGWMGVRDPLVGRSPQCWQHLGGKENNTIMDGWMDGWMDG